MYMFPTFLDTIPKTRSQMVNEMEIPDITVTPYIWTDPEESLTVRSDSILTGSDDCDINTLSTDSSIALSRAMTDSEIDYGRHRRLLSRSFSDPWDQMRATLDAFPPGYLASLSSFQTSLTDTTDDSVTSERLHQYNEELKLKMERFFDKECRVFTPDDPGLLALEAALEDIDLKILDSDWESFNI